VKTISIILLLFSILFLGCKPEEETPIIYPGLPQNVRFAKLSRSFYTNSSTLIANGKNSISFFLTFYDADKNVLTQPTPPGVRIIVNGTTELLYPFKFTTTKPGTYIFSLLGFLESSILAIADKELPQAILPIIFHYIIPYGQTVDNIQITSLLLSNIDQLNQAFENKNNSKNSSAVDIGITFKLATNAPDGKVLDVSGLHTVKSVENKFDDKDDPELNNIIWAGNYWSPKKYVNVWICNFADKYSYGNFPRLSNSSAEFPDYSYGIFFKSDHFYSSYSQSIIVHEMGHILNLFHTFDPNCDFDSDYCEDTQYYKRSYADDSPFELQRTPCFGEKFIGVNYMDYWPNEYNTFTYDQRERIRETINLCPFLPTPKNNASSGGRVEKLVSNQDMKWKIYPESGTY
jgi:hypothetical protein